MGTGHGVLGLRQLTKQPLHFILFERHIDLNRCVAGDAGGDAGSNLLEVQGLFLALELLE
jgi:hypothetical protein